MIMIWDCNIHVMGNDISFEGIFECEMLSFALKGLHMNSRRFQPAVRVIPRHNPEGVE